MKWTDAELDLHIAITDAVEAKTGDANLATAVADDVVTAMRKQPVRQTATLRNWYRVGDVLYGNAYGHPDYPRIMEGEPVRTSRVVEMGDGWAKTLNTDYTLEGPPRFSQDDPTPTSEGD